MRGVFYLPMLTVVAMSTIRPRGGWAFWIAAGVCWWIAAGLRGALWF